MLLEEWAGNRREAERRRALERRRRLRRRRRNRQILRRLGIAAVSLVLVVTGVIKIAAAGGEKQPQQQNILQVKAGYKYTEAALAANDSIGRKEEPDAVRIVVDAGHGGKDPGTLWGDVYEKDINLAIAQKLEQVLQAEGYEVIMTRNGDVKLGLEERVQIAEKNRADLFVSIHQNALEHDNVTSGIEIYCNESADPDSGKLADSIHTYLLDATGAVDKGVRKDSDFYVVQNASMPACLIETGFLTADKEREKLLDEAYQSQAAQGIADGIREFLEKGSDISQNKI